MNRHVTLLAAASLLLVSLIAAPCARSQDLAVDGGAKIVNGLPSPGNAATGVLLWVGPDVSAQDFMCSGVMIGCRTFLTAAHCICPGAGNAAECEAAFPDVADLRVFFAHGGTSHVRELWVKPSYLRSVRGDIAIVRMSRRIDGIHPVRINRDGQPGNFFRASIAGFGVTDEGEKDEGIRRFGEVQLRPCPGRIAKPANVCWEFEAPLSVAPTDSNICFGDDGGPLISDFGAGPVLVGVNVGNSPGVTDPDQIPPTCGPGVVGYATNVYNHRNWIAKKAGIDVFIERCGDLPKVGDDEVMTLGAAAELPRSEKEARYSFDVPSRTFKIRVGISGSNKRRGDFDLLVALDRPPFKGDFDCTIDHPGFYGMCELNDVDPETRSVELLVEHVRQDQGRGRSAFQVTVTFFRAPFEGDPPADPNKLSYVKRSATRRLLTWRDNSSDEEGFLLQRKIGHEFNEFFDHAILRANQAKFGEEVDPELTYTYRVRAFNEKGASRYSNNCIVNEDKPVRPLGLRAAELNARSILLKWRDRSNNEAGFQLQRRKFGERRWETIALTGQNERTYLDETVKPAKTYQYRVRAQGRINECVPNSKYAPVKTFSTPAG